MTTPVDGRTLRATTPRTSHAAWTAAPDRDAVATMREIFATLLPDLVSLRIERMSRSPFAFLRGSAAVMAADLSGSPSIGITAQLCGDAHLANFGGFATPERRLVFDVNDFDETARGPWEWDVKRLAASVALAGRAGGVVPRAIDAAVRLTVQTYRLRTREYAQMTPLETWYASIDIADAVQAALNVRERREWERLAQRAVSGTALRVLPKLTTVAGGRLRFNDNPPTLVHETDERAALDYANRVLDAYRATLRTDAEMLLGRFAPVDLVRKVSGVGSVGTWCALVLLADDRGNELLLQLKEARASALAPHVAAPRETVHGERVVAGQRMMQAASDAFLGWADMDRCLYVRQYRDMKTTIDPSRLPADELADYGAHCAWALARAHARTGEPRITGAYMGRGTTFDDALVAFAHVYADQTERDHAAFVAAFQPAPVPGATGKK